MNFAEIKQTIRYCKRNGIKDTFLAAGERLEEKIRARKKGRYTYEEPSEEELKKQMAEYEAMETKPLISIVVPLYNTEPVFLEDLILSVMDQTYQNFELVFGDASEETVQETVVKEFQEQYGKINYIKIGQNGGISENTNAILEKVQGDYVALLDHDDVLTKDALYHMVTALHRQMEKLGVKQYSQGPTLLYSDEDKVNAYMENYFAQNIKPGYNLDLLLTNNYVCHLSMYRKDVIKALGLRKAYDGAQDFDLVLRTVLVTEEQVGKDNVKDYIVHVGKVLYHWRSSASSTAENTDAKNYAYEAGGRAIESFLTIKGWDAEVVSLKHLGFYRVEYANLFETRPDVGVVVRPIYKKGRLALGGLQSVKGEAKVLYGGLKKGYSGYLHRAALQQQIKYGDIRCMEVRPELRDLFQEVTGYSYPLADEEREAFKDEEKNTQIVKKSIKFCNKLKEMGITIVYDPMEKVEKNEADC